MENSRRFSSRPGRPLVTLAAAAAFVLASPELAACGAIFGEDVELDEGVQCVKKVDPNSADDDVDVEVVDPQYCDQDGYYATQHGGGVYFISTGGGYYGFPIGTVYHHTIVDGGRPLFSSTDTATRTTVGVAKTFNGSTTVGKVTVKSGGFGSVGTSHGSSGSSGGSHGSSGG